MGQVINMRRLHMGCGESLRSALPLTVSLKRRANTTNQAAKSADIVNKGSSKNQRDESR